MLGVLEVKSPIKKNGRMTSITIMEAKEPASFAVGTKVLTVTQSAVKRKYDESKSATVEMMSQGSQDIENWKGIRF